MGNSSNAYVTKQANPVDPSAWINKQQEISQYYDQVAAQKEREKLAREDKLRGEFKDDFEGEFDLTSMGNDAVNKVFTPMAMQSLQDLKTAKYEGEKALTTFGINSKEYKQAKLRHDNILQRPSLFKLSFEQTAGKLNDYNKLVADGKIVQNPNNVKNLQEIISTPIRYKQDENGRYLLMQGDKVYTMDEFADKLDLGKMIPKVDEGSIISGITETIKDKEFDKIMGYRTVKTTNPWDDYTNPETKEKQSGIKSILTRGFKNALTDEVMESVLAGRGEFKYDEFVERAKNGDKEAQNTIDQLKSKVVDEWTQIGRGQISEKLGVDFDSSRYGTDVRSNEKDEKTSTPLYQTGNEPLRSTYGAWIKDVDPNKVNNVSVTFPKEADKKLTFKTVSGDDVSVNNVYSFTKNKFDRYILSVEEVTDKGGALSKEDEDKKIGEWASQGLNAKQIAEKIAQLPQNSPQKTKVRTVEVDKNQLEKLGKTIGATIEELESAVVKNNQDTENKKTIEGF